MSKIDIILMSISQNQIIDLLTLKLLYNFSFSNFKNLNIIDDNAIAI